MRRSAALLLVMLAAGCAGGNEAADTVTVTETVRETTTVTTETEPTTTPAPGAWNGLTEPLPTSGTLPVDEFNAHAESVDEPWERDVRRTVDEYVGPDQTDAPSISFQATSTGEQSGPTSASLTLDGLLDDSVRARRYDLTLTQRPDGTWQIEAASWSQRCQVGRGHQTFSPALCL